MIKEAYVSYDVAKLLEKKGFWEEVSMYYDTWDENDIELCSRSDISSELFSYQPEGTYVKAPTHQMACAWIRAKGYIIEIQANPSGFVWSIDKLNGTNVAWSDFVGPNDDGAWDDYDECMENALMYCLVNLI